VAALSARLAIARVRASLPGAVLTARRANALRGAPQADAQVSARRAFAPLGTLDAAPGLHCWRRRTAELGTVGTNAVGAALVTSAVVRARLAFTEISTAKSVTAVGTPRTDTVLSALARCGQVVWAGERGKRENGQGV
jgi:hypothetical protein